MKRHSFSFPPLPPQSVHLCINEARSWKPNAKGQRFFFFFKLKQLEEIPSKIGAKSDAWIAKLHFYPYENILTFSRPHFAGLAFLSSCLGGVYHLYALGFLLSANRCFICATG